MRHLHGITHPAHPHFARRRSAAAAALVLASLAAFSGVAGASTFAGRCQLTGTLSYSHAVGFAPTAVRWFDHGTGTCTGVVNGESATIGATMSERLQDDTGGCGPTSDAHGPGRLTFGSHLGTIRYQTSHPLVIGAPFVADDDTGGIAAGVLTAYLHGSLPILQECLDESFTTGQFDLILQTITPLRISSEGRTDA